jgi:SAM-dependent methyltransferase
VIAAARRRIGRFVSRLRNRKFVLDASNRFSRENLNAMIDREIARLEEPPGARQVLCVGSGGELAQRVAGIRGARVTSVDIDPARRPDVVADVCDLRAFADGSFDAVFLLEVLEHVREPALAIGELRRVLAEGGALVLSTPFVFEIHEAPHDYYRFTEHGLRHLLRDFASCRIERRNGYFKATLVPWLRLTRSRYPSDMLIGLLALAVCTALSPLLDLLDRAIRSDAATTGYFATCRK